MVTLTVTHKPYFPSLWNVWYIVVFGHFVTRKCPNFQSLDTEATMDGSLNFNSNSIGLFLGSKLALLSEGSLDPVKVFITKLG